MIFRLYWSRWFQAVVLTLSVICTAALVPSWQHLQQSRSKNILEGELPLNLWTAGIDYAAKHLPPDAKQVIVLVRARAGDLLAPSERTALAALTEELNALPFVLPAAGESLAHFPLIRREHGVFRVAKRPLMIDDHASPGSLKTDLAASYAYERLISADWTASIVILRLRDGAEETRVATSVRDVARRYQTPTRDVMVLGSPVLEAEISTLVQRDGATLVPLAMIAVAALFAILLQDLLGGVVCLGVIIAAIVWCCGILDLVGFRFTPITAATPVFIVALGSYPFHILSRFRATPVSWPHRARIRAALRAVPAIVLASLTTIAGFGTLGVFDIEAVSDLGTCIPLAVLCLFVATLTITPAALVLFGRGRLRRPARGAGTVVARTAEAIHDLGRRRTRTCTWTLLGALPVLTLWVLASVDVGIEPLGFLEPQNRVRVAYDTMAEHFGASDGLPLVVVFDRPEALTRPDVMGQLEALNADLIADPRIARVDSLAATLAHTRASFGHDPGIPDTPDALRAELGLYRREERMRFHRTVAYPSYDATRIYVATNEAYDDRRLADLVRDVRRSISTHLPGATGYPVGQRTRWVAQNEYMIPGLATSLGAALFIELVICVLFGTLQGGWRRGLGLALLCVVPALLVVLLALAVFPFLDLRLDFANLVIVSVVLGICPDFAIHMADHPDSAPTVIGDGLSNAVGFAVLPLLSTLAPVAALGGLIVLTMILAPPITILWVAATRRALIPTAHARKETALMPMAHAAALAIIAAVALTASPTRAATIDLETFLAGVENEQRVREPLRADIDVETIVFGRRAREQVIQIHRPDDDTQIFTQFRDDGSKMLSGISAGHDRYYDAAIGGVPFAFGHDQNFAGTDFTKEDLEAFVAADFTAEIVREDEDSVTIELRPRGPSAYSRRVVEFTRQHKLASTVQLFRGAGTTPSKTLTSSRYVRVGAHWRPRLMRMEDHEAESSSTLTVSWSASPTFSPRIFHPASMNFPSGLVWTTPASRSEDDA